MKVCVTSAGEGENSPVEKRFGRAPYFVFVDTESGEVKSVKNPLVNESGGVGPRAVQLISGEGAGAVITGQVGGNASTTLQVSGIEVYAYAGSGNVKDAVESYNKGELGRII